MILAELRHKLSKKKTNLKDVIIYADTQEKTNISALWSANKIKFKMPTKKTNVKCLIDVEYDEKFWILISPIKKLS